MYVECVVQNTIVRLRHLSILSQFC